MNKIALTVCCGTYCHIMGGSDLQLLDEVLPLEIMRHVDYRFTNCMGFCRDESGKPPYAKVNETIIPEATKEKILSQLKKELGGYQNDSK